ncbi:T9SS C-terminal target domain-containing protein, partial [Muribaculaceae bacterium Isolate-100 (HZI)]
SAPSQIARPALQGGTSILHLRFSCHKFNTFLKIHAPGFRLEPFDLHTSSIENTSVSLSDDISFTVAGTLITATSVSESHLSLHIYDTSGRKVAEVSGHGSTDYDFSGAKSGVYIILCGDKTIKYLNR